MTTLLQVAHKAEKDFRDTFDKLSKEKSAQIASVSLLVAIDLTMTVSSYVLLFIKSPTKPPIQKHTKQFLILSRTQSIRCCHRGRNKMAQIVTAKPTYKYTAHYRITTQVGTWLSIGRCFDGGEVHDAVKTSEMVDGVYPHHRKTNFNHAEPYVIEEVESEITIYGL